MTTVTLTGGKILYGAFHNCKNLTSIALPEGLTSIGAYAFRNCTGLKNVSIPNSVTSIGSYAFYGCTALTNNPMIPNLSVTSIGSYAFYGCSALRGITIPDSVTSIGDYAFYACTGLTAVYYTGTEEGWANVSIGNNNTSLSSATIHYGISP